jgi:DNA adenine methylase
MKRPILRYYGGKWRIAPQIAAHFPPHRIYVEPYGGAGSVLLRKNPAEIEVYNDLFGDVVNVFRVLRNPETASKLKAACELTPFSRAEFAAPISRADQVEWARQVIFKSFASRRGAPHSADGTFRNTIHLSLARQWANWPELIGQYTARLRHVVIENRDALDVARAYDSPGTLHYIDPPYMQESRHNKRIYYLEMSDSDHRKLLEACKELKGMVVVSGYESELYSELLGGWRRAFIKAQTDSNKPRKEVLWMNFEPKNGQMRMF